MFVEGMVNHWQHLRFKLEPYIAIPCSSKFPMCVDKNVFFAGRPRVGHEQGSVHDV